jgi:SpoVK/Ycf46/Vps4 family AAA+-type ATPase
MTMEESTLAAVHCGMFLIRDAGEPYAVLVRGPSEMGHLPKFVVEAAARTKEGAERLLANLRSAMRDRNVYRGRIISLERSEHSRSMQVRFHRLPKVERHQIVLPANVLERLERHTLHFSRHGQRLRTAGRHLKRGVLLHGRPGTGKTLAAMYLASQSADRTVMLLSAFDYGALHQACQMARALEPALLILEDVDLIAEDRERPGCTSPFLFELLNQMDGIAEDADVIFLLTTNRAAILEPALASRPGRVDLALEFPLPDTDCRRALFELYSHGLTMQVADMDHVIARTEGASAAFIRELLRKAALLAADETGSAIFVTDRHLDEALRELMLGGGELTGVLLGAATSQNPS